VIPPALEQFVQPLIAGGRHHSGKVIRSTRKLISLMVSTASHLAGDDCPLHFARFEEVIAHVVTSGSRRRAASPGFADAVTEMLFEPRPQLFPTTPFSNFLAQRFER